jgi:hypothetical protein
MSALSAKAVEPRLLNPYRASEKRAESYDVNAIERAARAHELNGNIIRQEITMDQVRPAE